MIDNLKIEHSALLYIWVFNRIHKEYMCASTEEHEKVSMVKCIDFFSSPI